MRSLGGGPGGSLGFRSLPYGWVWRSACPFHSQKGPRGPVSYRPRGLPARKSPSTVRACSIFFEARLQRVAAPRSFLRTRRPPVSAGARRESGRGRPALPDPPSAAGTSPARSSRSRRCLLVRVSSCVHTHVPVGQVSRGGRVTRKGKRSGHTTAGPRDPAGAHLALALHGHRPLAPHGLFCGKPAKSSGGARPSGRRSEAPPHV